MISTKIRQAYLYDEPVYYQGEGRDLGLTKSSGVILNVRSIVKLPLILLVLVFITTPISAQPTRYISDKLSAPIRTGKSTAHKIIRLLSSGTAVEVLEETDNGYSRIKTPRDIEGWILSRHLMDQPSSREQLVKAEKQLATLKSTNQELWKAVEAMEETRESLLECNRELEIVSKSAANTIQIERENLELKQDLEEKIGEVQALKKENQELKDESRQTWFVTGASVALGSLFFGLIIPRIPWRKRKSWDQF